ncbi:hypothetical protein JL720_13412 [Aureococcus anophagefferens]|nr:hypothetical protein JL720_13412 [Aureococcus anophagefferens]
MEGRATPPAPRSPTRSQVVEREVEEMAAKRREMDELESALKAKSESLDARVSRLRVSAEKQRSAGRARRTPVPSRSPASSRAPASPRSPASSRRGGPWRRRPSRAWAPGGAEPRPSPGAARPLPAAGAGDAAAAKWASLSSEIDDALSAARPPARGAAARPRSPRRRGRRPSPTSAATEGRQLAALCESVEQRQRAMLDQADRLAAQERQLAARLAAVVAQQDRPDDGDDDDFAAGDRPFAAATLVEAAALLEPRRDALATRAAREPERPGAAPSRLERVARRCEPKSRPSTPSGQHAAGGLQWGGGAAAPAAPPGASRVREAAAGAEELAALDEARSRALELLRRPGRVRGAARWAAVDGVYAAAAAALAAAGGDVVRVTTSGALLRVSEVALGPDEIRLVPSGAALEAARALAVGGGEIGDVVATVDAKARLLKRGWPKAAFEPEDFAARGKFTTLVRARKPPPPPRGPASTKAGPAARGPRRRAEPAGPVVVAGGLTQATRDGAAKAVSRGVRGFGGRVVDVAASGDWITICAAFFAEPPLRASAGRGAAAALAVDYALTALETAARMTWGVGAASG